MYDEMAKEHGVPETKGQAEKILQKLYPNVKVTGDPDDKIKQAEADAVLAMMAAAEYFPEATEFLEAFRIGDKDDGALAAAGVDGMGTFFISLKKRINNTVGGMSDRERNYIVANQMAYKAREAGASQEEAKRVVAMGAAIHELVHMQHFAKQMEWLGGPKNALKKLRNYSDEDIDDKIKELRKNLDNLNELGDDLEKFHLVRPDLSDENLLKALIRSNMLAMGTHFIGETKKTMYDSLSEEEISESRKAMDVSEYARKDDMEGVAESISGRLLGLEAPDNPMHQWIAPDVKADSKDGDDDDLKFQTCRGYDTGPPGREDTPDREEK